MKDIINYCVNLIQENFDNGLNFNSKDIIIFYNDSCDQFEVEGFGFEGYGECITEALRSFAAEIEEEIGGEDD